MIQTRRRRFVALTAMVTLLGAQPAVVCGLLCLATHTAAAPIAQHHHGSEQAPCNGGRVTAAHGIPLELHAAGAALPVVVTYSIPLPDEVHTASDLVPAPAPLPPPDLQDPPPRG